MKPVQKKKKKQRGGRPSREEAALLSSRILDAAAHLFFTQGYGATSIEAVAARARISKRTFYTRFRDKADLLHAVVHRVIEKLTPPHADTGGLFAGGACAEILHRLAPMILRAALTPEAVALHHLIIAEAVRFPELASAASGQGARQEAIRRIGALLERENAAGRMRLADPAFAAEQFLQMLVSVPQRRAMGIGKPMTAAELDVWARDSVDLFLNGCRV